MRAPSAAWLVWPIAIVQILIAVPPLAWGLYLLGWSAWGTDDAESAAFAWFFGILGLLLGVPSGLAAIALLRYRRFTVHWLVPTVVWLIVAAVLFLAMWGEPW